MLRLLIHSYPLPSPALMAFKLYLALLEFLLKCISTLSHDPVYLPSPKHSRGARMPGRAAQFWHSGTVPRPPVAAVSAGAAHGPASSPRHCQAPLPLSQWGVSVLGGAGARGDSSRCCGPSPSTFPAGEAPWCAPCRGSVADEWLSWLEAPSASGAVSWVRGS